ncbi:transketolase [Glacieibacterium megasporae]|uniref:transketolase n=1 Tax=Glacieibacterium megasporae TaxID=2835787 RepID=UPI001C1E21EC|nr:transketolase [Polymorphobacter megasporae]UAJ10542.1 transketolase [Polymorphobacter megasporae]
MIDQRRTMSQVHENGSARRLAIDTIRTLAMDAVQAANSGHPGTPMGLAPVGYTLWNDVLRFDPTAPDWPNRDRFVLSVGHASMLLYAILHLAGVQELDGDGVQTGNPAVSLDDIKAFRQLDSKTPGHPEYRRTTGVETTTGPLGQGCGNSVGMAIAAQALGSRFNRPDFALFDFNTYVFCGDGDMMEGVSGEAASLAGHLALSNLCWIYDSNSISIEGSTEIAFTEDVAKRFAAYGWNVIHVADANDTVAVGEALAGFAATTDRPTFIIVHSVIGYGSPRAGLASAHGEPLGMDNVRSTKRAYGWPEDAQFLVPPEVAAAFTAAVTGRGKSARREWEARLAGYGEIFPELAAEFELLRRNELPVGWNGGIPDFPADAKGMASRDAGGEVLNAIASRVLALMGGAADLSPSTKTNLTFDGAGSFEPDDYAGRNMHFGVREHAMGAIANGMTVTYLRGYTGTFLVFADYMRAPIRLAAIMAVPTIFIFTHDSIGVGEDGPTHQPIEHLATLRAIPGLNTIRPGDANEVVVAWKTALMQTHVPTAMILSRQAIPTLDRTRYAAANGLTRGGYVLGDCEGIPEIVLIGTGSELPMVVAAHEALLVEGVRSRVVSLPSWYLFEQQDAAYRYKVFPRDVRARLAVEQGGAFGWDRYVGSEGATITMSTFGASAPLAELQARYGFTIENICAVARDLIGKTR